MTTTSDRSVGSPVYREMLAALPDTVVYVHKARVKEANRHDAVLFTTRPAPGAQLSDVFHPDLLARVQGLLKGAAESGSAAGEYETADGLFRIVATKLQSSPGFMLFFQDLTVRRTAEHALLELVQGKTTFLTSVSNQLRSPLAAVIAYAELLSQPDPDLDDRVRADMVRHMTDQAWDLAGMIDDLLTMARAELGELAVATVPVNLLANVAQIVESLGDRGKQVSVSGENWISASGDPARVRQIVRNLLSTAMAHGHGPISVLVNSMDSGAVLTIEYQGTELDDEDQIALVGGDAGATQANPQLTGVGLSISQELARLMRGRITYARISGVTTFQLWLPLLGS